MSYSQQRPPALPMAPPPSAYAASNDAAMMMRYDANKKSALLAYLLLFVLGGFGAHRFYLGRTGSAVAMLVIWLLSWLLLAVVIGVFGLIAVGIWLIVDAFLIPGMTEAFNNRLVTQLRGGALQGW